MMGGAKHGLVQTLKRRTLLQIPKNKKEKKNQPPFSPLFLSLFPTSLSKIVARKYNNRSLIKKGEFRE